MRTGYDLTLKSNPDNFIADVLNEQRWIQVLCKNGISQSLRPNVSG